MFEEFSAGYSIGRFYIEHSGGDHAVMDKDHHKAANQQMYATDNPIERLNHPP